MMSRISGGIVALLGLAILWYGAQLALVGGSPFYVVMAIGLVVSGVLLMTRRQLGLGIYALTLVLTFIWTIYEVGFG